MYQINLRRVKRWTKIQITTAQTTKIQTIVLARTQTRMQATQTKTQMLLIQITQAKIQTKITNYFKGVLLIGETSFCEMKFIDTTLFTT